MFRKVHKILAGLALTGATVFQAGSCDTLADAFIEGVNIGYEAETGEPLFDTTNEGLWDIDDCGCAE